MIYLKPLMTVRFMLLGAMLAAAGYAQGDRGLLTGIVKDPSGAAIAGAAVRALHAATTRVLASTYTCSTSALSVGSQVVSQLSETQC